MGMFGAILATGFSPIISLLVMLPYLLKGKQKFRFDFSNIKIKEMFESIKLGVPSFVVEISSGIVIVVFNTIILKLSGNIGVAAYGVIANVSLVIIAIFTGMAQGMQPVLSRSYAVNKKQEIKYILKETLSLAGIVSLFIVIIVSSFVFTGDNNFTVIIITNGVCRNTLNSLNLRVNNHSFIWVHWL